MARTPDGPAGNFSGEPGLVKEKVKKTVCGFFLRFSFSMFFLLNFIVLIQCGSFGPDVLILAFWIG